MITPYNIKIAPAARRQILAVSPKAQKNILRIIEALAVNPRPPGAKKIDGMTGLYNEEVNHHQIIYKIEEQEILVLLIK
ncbi:MAG: hypothetical protein ACD_46C00622G0001 [uncultured bacterium]|nr:MAG: hypothetical protein ACD_46C00622G0001 [uncultured bacterium]